MSKPKILVVEDEAAFVDALEVGLGREGFEILIARDGAQALEVFESGDPDVILLDVMLPVISGIDVCRQIRTTSQVPILMVTAKSEEIDAVVGLEVGADDYVTKPYRMRELVARIRAALRRAQPPEGSGVADGVVNVAIDGEDIVEVGDVMIDIQRHEVCVRGDLVELPLKEFDVLTLLMENAGRVVTRDILIDRVWGMDYVGDTKTLDVHIKRLRSKVETDPKDPERILTVRGLGYKYAG